MSKATATPYSPHVPTRWLALKLLRLMNLSKKGILLQLLLSFLCLMLVSCGGWQSDSTEDLAGNYKYVFESRESSFIYGGIKEQKVIPCTVESYAYNDDFILAKQKAKKECVFPHDNEQEEDKVYFWIVDIKHDTLYRADSREAYKQTLTRLHVPKELQL